MRTLVVAPQPFFTSRGTPLSVYYRALAMAEQGVEIDLLTYGSGKNVRIPGVRVIRVPRLKFLEPLPVGPSWSKLLLDVLMVPWTVGLLLRRRYRVVHAHEEAVFWCWLLKPVFRFRLIYDMHSSLPQQLVNFRFTRSRLLIATFGALERRSVDAADAIITICPDLTHHAVKRGADPARVLMIENSMIDEVKFERRAPAGATDPGHPPAVFGPEHEVILYAGTFEAYQGVDLLVAAFARVLRQNPAARLLLIGGTGEQVAQMRNLADSLGLGETCVMTGHLPRATVIGYVAPARIVVSMRLHGNNTPLKIYELMASGRPLVATRVYAHTQVLDDSVCFLADPDADSLAECLLRVLGDRAEAARRSANALERYQRDYTRTAYEAKIRRLLDMIA